jgi:hypothetical protein
MIFPKKFDLKFFPGMKAGWFIAAWAAIGNLGLKNFYMSAPNAGRFF